MLSFTVIHEICKVCEHYGGFCDEPWKTSWWCDSEIGGQHGCSVAMLPTRDKPSIWCELELEHLLASQEQLVVTEQGSL